MALHADELIRLLAPSPERWEFALRQALICALTTLVVQIYQTPDPALTVYIVFFLNRPDRATSLIMNAAFLVLISIVIGLIIVTTMVVIDQPVWRVASIATLSFGLLFLASSSKLRPVGATVALIVGYGLDLLGMAHIGEIATRGLLYAWGFVAIPATVSMVVNLLIAPPPRRLAERALAHRLQLCAMMLRGPAAPIRTEFAECLHEGPGELPAWLKLAGAEKTSPPQDIAALHQAAQSTTAIMLLVDLIESDPEHMLPRALCDDAAHVLDDMASILVSGGYPIEISFDTKESEAALSPLSAMVLAELRGALIRFAETLPPAPSPSPAAKASGGFFAADAFSNPEHVQYALKTTAAAMFCYWLYSMLDWPSIHTCFITCYIVGLTTTAETVEKLTLRILGCMVGAATGIAAIVFLVPSLTSIGTLMAVVFLGALVSAWIAAGSPRIAYAGYQVAFAFFLCVMQGSAPAFDMTTARDRVIGILLGNVVSYFVFTFVWPVSVAWRVDPAFSALLRRMSAMMSATSISARRELAAETLTSYGAIERDLSLIPYEPRWVRPSEDWLRHRLDAMREIVALTGSLLLSADRSPELSPEFDRRLARLADALSDPKPTPVMATPQETTQAHASDLVALRELIGKHLQDLERAVARGVASASETNYAPA